MSRNRVEYLREWRQTHKEHSRKYKNQYNVDNRDHVRRRSRSYARQFRRKVLKFFGDKCIRCGFNDYRALQLDHIHGGGAREHRLSTGVYGIYRRALKNPEEFQLLCANCNNIKRYEEGEGVCLDP